jgi:hypothetical protein
MRTSRPRGSGIGTSRMTYGSPNFPLAPFTNRGTDLDHLRSLHGLPHLRRPERTRQLTWGRCSRTEGREDHVVRFPRAWVRKCGAMSIPVSRANEASWLCDRHACSNEVKLILTNKSCYIQCWCQGPAAGRFCAEKCKDLICLVLVRSARAISYETGPTRGPLIREANQRERRVWTMDGGVVFHIISPFFCFPICSREHLRFPRESGDVASRPCSSCPGLLSHRQYTGRLLTGPPAARERRCQCLASRLRGHAKHPVHCFLQRVWYILHPIVSRLTQYRRP